MRSPDGPLCSIIQMTYQKPNIIPIKHSGKKGLIDIRTVQYLNQIKKADYEDTHTLFMYRFKVQTGLHPELVAAV
jgi:hypothetical protein